MNLIILMLKTNREYVMFYFKVSHSKGIDMNSTFQGLE